MELKKYKLGDIAEIINGATPSTDCNDNYDGEIVWITPKDLSDQKSKYIEKGSRKITQKGYDSCSTQMIPSYNILMSSRAPIGLLAINKVDCCTNQGFKNIIVNKSICNVDYLYYYLKFHIKEIEALGSGTTFKEVSKVALQKFEINIPNLEEQKRIGNLLSALDQKIALNRQINDNLETMAKQLYDYWFVQFDFPNEEGKPYKSSGGKMVWNEKLKREIPEGWSAKSIFDEMSIQYGFPFSTDDFTEEVTNIPVVRIRDILDNTISVYSYEETDDKYRLNEADLLIGMDGNFHINYWINNIAYLNQRSVRLRSKQNSNVSIVQARYDIEPYIKAKEQRAKGSTVGHLSDKDLKELKVMICPNREMRDALDSLLYRIIANRKENLSLTKQRDELLPLLMNGQVSVNYHLYALLYIDSLILNYTLNARLYEKNIFRHCNSPIRSHFYSRANCDGGRDSRE